MIRKVRDIDYHLMPSTERSTTDIVIERDGNVVVRAPDKYTPEQVDEVVENKRMWIYRNLAEWRDLNSSKVVREWVNGESFLYLGSTYRLLLVSNQSEPLLLKNGRFCLQREAIETGGVDAAKDIFETFYTQKAQKRLEKRVEFYAPKAGVSPTSVKVKDHRFRWASCSKKGALKFHWKCMMATPKVIDYIVVHELCHMHHNNHSDAFWNEVDKVMPDYKERKEWLRRHGAGLDL